MESEHSSIFKLPLMFTTPHKVSPEPSGTVTPPFETSASVPFQWELEPGKPKPCTTLTLSNPDQNAPKSLELPPRLFAESQITKTPSPTSVLDGPYVGKSKSVFQSSSFRFIREGNQESFGIRSSSFGSLGHRTLKVKGNKKEVCNGGGSIVFPSFMDIEEDGYGGDDDDDEISGSSTRVKMTSIKSNGSFSNLSQSKSHFWSSIYKGFKQVIPWSRKSKKEG